MCGLLKQQAYIIIIYKDCIMEMSAKYRSVIASV